MIPVTKPFLPPKDLVKSYVDGIWERHWLTNSGPLVVDLEDQLKKKLDVPELLFVTNGTLALQLAIKALELHGEVITTPFSYIATTSALLWEGCKPIFVDIDERTLNIDVNQIRNKINDKTTGILATNVFGNPCDFNAIQNIANEFNLKVIYDAAHSFGTTYENRSVLNYGDISTISFHATKLFHTVEGGAIICKTKKLFEKLEFLRNFGHHGVGGFEEVGINGKNSELHAAIGLCNLKFVDQILETREKQAQHYKNVLPETLQFLTIQKNTTNYNYAYFPIIFESEEVLFAIEKNLNAHHVYPRRYFYPSLNTLQFTNEQSCPNSEDISKRILCMPLYHTLTTAEIDFISHIIVRTLNNIR